MTWRILHGDCREMLKSLPDESVHCCVTSPPYWGLRDYGTAKWEGGEPGCKHAESELRRGVNLAQSHVSIRGGAKKIAEVGWLQYKHLCGKCGAVRLDQQIGLERTPEEYVANMVEVFREVRRVLRPDGTLWLNLGDSYAGSGRGGDPYGSSGLEGSTESQDQSRQASRGVRKGSAHGESGHTSGVPTPPGIKPKDLCGIPWMVAFALRADGWYLRQDIIWAKPNPMPESVTDRCTKAHEYIFLLSKRPRYYYDHIAIAEESISSPSDIRKMVEAKDRMGGKTLTDSQLLHAANCTTNIGTKRAVGSPDGRNKRSVWTVTTKPFSEAHFATFPPDLIEPCIKAGCPEGGTVLDPFNGAGTSGLVATRLGRSYIGVELNPEYVAMSTNRIVDDAPMFNQPEVTT